VRYRESGAQFGDVVGPIEKLSTGIPLGGSESGTVGGEDGKTRPPRGFIPKESLFPRTGEAVEVYYPSLSRW
jgi:hypothetical protein